MRSSNSSGSPTSIVIRSLVMSLIMFATLTVHSVKQNSKYGGGVLVSAFSSFGTRATSFSSRMNRQHARQQIGSTCFHRGLSSSSTSEDQNDKKKPPSYWTTDNVRSSFISYFAEKRDHTAYPSSPCVPLNDPTLLFTNAGMNQFKPIFLGQTDPASPLAQLTRAANSQKCIRAGGKHNDLDDVGRDTYHHTFFEMLGSWSFGDYFKKEAIDYAWELLTEVYGIDPDRLYATYFEGDEGLGLEADLEAKQLWLRYLPEERVIGCNAKDNFWEMGETGPCGPCSEIHYDRIGNRDASALVNADDPNVIEIWNLVFIQYNRDTDGLNTLPQQHIDTGMGLERLVSLLQEQTSNYDIDVFQPLFDKIAEFSKVGPYGGLVAPMNMDGEEKVDEEYDEAGVLRDTAYRAIADHARTLCFAIADGAVPNNEGRGYVLRRVLRRATRYGQQVLKAEPGFFATLIPVVVDTFGEAFPELVKNQKLITEIIVEEEQAFSTMLNRGIKYFSDLCTDLSQSDEKPSTVVPGGKAFFLYDTMGFPIDLTEQMAEEAGLTVDVDGFQKAMDEQKQRSRDARRAAKGGDGKGVKLELVAEQTAWLAENGVDATDDEAKYEWDVEVAATVKAIFGSDGFLQGDGASGVASEGDYVGLILDTSSFYAEAGGQEADTGFIHIMNEDEDVVAKFKVTDVQTYGGFLLHSGVVVEGDIAVGASGKCTVDYERRRDVAPNHTMTHVLNAALRKVLGDGVEQRGSLCNEEKLRFDFSHKKAMTLKQLQETEDFIRNSIKSAEPVTAEVMPLEEARALDGVRAVFGEVYPDPVRVVSVGTETSSEFCGGTHLSNTAEAEAFALVEETAVAKGIRRISGVTKSLALQAIGEGEKFEQRVKSVEAETGSSESDALLDLDKRAGAMRKELDATYMSAPLKAELRGRIERLQKAGVEAKKAQLAKRVNQCLKVVEEEVKKASEDGKKWLVLTVDIGADSKASQKVINTVKKMAPEMAFLGLSEEVPDSGGKLLCFSVVPDGLVGDDSFRADEWVKSTLAACGGRGGGRPGNAQGQAKECSDITSVMNTARAFAEAGVGTVAA